MLGLSRRGLETGPLETAPGLDPTCERLVVKLHWPTRPKMMLRIILVIVNFSRVAVFAVIASNMKSCQRIGRIKNPVNPVNPV